MVDRNERQKTTLLYVMDPHCGWCFGFGIVIEQLYDRYRNDDRVRFEVLPGGLFVPKILTSKDFAEGKRSIWERISHLSGVTVSDSYFANVIGEGGYLDSEVPCRVINTASHLRPDRLIPFMEALLTQEFTHGRNISDYASAEPVIDKFGFDLGEFKTAFSSDFVAETTRANFDRARAIADGYPVLFAVSESGELKVLAKGFAPFDTLKKRVDEIVNSTHVA
jgi:putative protein-disulfide isomerase